MTEFAYVARSPSGERVAGTIEAENRREALSALAGKSLFPLEIRGDAPVRTAGRGPRVPAQAMANTYSQMADLLRSGVPLLRTLDVLRRQSSRPALVDVLSQIHHYVEEGSTLAEAMERFPRVFGEMAVSMIRAGGEGGFLEEALLRVAEFTEGQEDLKKRVNGAMAYPMVLAGLGTVVVVVLLVFLVPMFESMFDGLRQKGELPALTDMLLGLSRFIKGWWWLLLGGLAAVGWFARRWLSSDRGRWWRDRVKLRLPLGGQIFQSLAVARFCRVLGTMLRNGVPILRSLEVSSEAAGNRVLASAIHDATENISAGQSLAKPLAACGHFPVAIVEMITVAEEANTLESVLIHIADSLERRTWRQIDLAVRLLEPLMLMLLAGMVLMLVVALLLPVLKMSSAF
jgi:general secretion pathway protein F/type IV pilus assembly protein PilC